ncbi:two-component system sensor histidine kinase KdpD [Ancylobacter sp. 3268]|uniref:sensor histidine kinase KdpD n=1 Tax=Ancylobacter sp. 3268 TaxID=2817752 RepID=UPI00286365B5|nr:sensor histidine kinase KdpD [Ancylobacter sp. 3268]MDR6951078.1 two-component system sensor histidine kinase KdpD [Ancylobacter sp. 3268]
MAATEPRDEGRPDPDALLASMRQETRLDGKRADGRGRLTIFLGAAPGVGKTYAMLARARKLKADIVVGLAETHGRSETAELLDGLEILPRRRVPYKGRVIETFDLDAALARKPRILILDELASSNPEGSRHPKRFQDIEELLAAGIDVWTALNIQHLESLADVVANITGIRVREQVPDTVLQKADEIILVDLPPAELIDRLKEGKVYLPESARRASERFFRLGNLTALRELALRRTADRVDDDMVDYLKGHAIEGAWASAERLLVCVGADALSEKVVREASRLASGLNAAWTVVSLERADSEPGEGAPARIDELLRLAERLGAETQRITANDFVAELIRLARREHVTQIVIGAPARRRWTFFRRHSLADAIVAHVPGIAVHVVTGDQAEAPADRPHRHARPARELIRAAAYALGSTSAAALIAAGIERAVPLSNVSLLFLMAVVVSAIRAGYSAAFLAAVLSGLAYNFLFIPPLYTFTIASPHEVFAFIVFLLAALLAGGLASRVSEQARAARARAAALQSLYDFSRKLSGNAEADDVLWVAVSQLHESFNRPAVILTQQDGAVALAAAWPPDADLDVGDMSAARWAFEHKEPAGRDTGTLPSSHWQFRPMTSPHGVVGILGLRWDAEPFDGAAEPMLAAIMDQTAIALDRARLAEQSIAQAARLQGDSLRTALLSSISHDLRTPLATITGAVTSLRQLGDRMDKASRDDLLATIEEEGARLSRFVSNLLDMTRIEAGTLETRRDWIEVGDVIRAAVERCTRYYPQLAIDVSIAADLPLMQGDSVLLGQVLFNLLDNAAKYAAGEPVKIFARTEGGEIVISVTDSGKGIAPGDLDKVFEKFFRPGTPDGRPPGTGLGLSIARGFVDAMGGTIKAESPATRRRGTRMVLRFPVPPGEARTPTP